MALFFEEKFVQILIRDTTSKDFSAILQLNTDYVHYTSPMDCHKLSVMDTQSCYHKVAEVDGSVAAFLIVMDQSSDYQSDNFVWFQKRYANFAYIDRIVVSDGYQKQGLGKRLYDDLFKHCAKAGVSKLACEYNLKPANPTSAKFHQKLGFTEVEQISTDNDKKRLSMQIADLDMLCK